MVAANKLLHLLEAFTTPWFLFSLPQNHHLAFYLLEIFNNIIQYQFDGEQREHASCQSDLSFNLRRHLSSGNFNLVYAIIRKRSAFHHLANLPSDVSSIQKALQRKKLGVSRSRSLSSCSSSSSTSSRPVACAKPGALKASLEATPGVVLLSLGLVSVASYGFVSGIFFSKQQETNYLFSKKLKLNCLSVKK